MKICFVSLQARGAFFPESGAKIGGAERQVQLLAQGLAESPNEDVHVIVEDSGQPEREKASGVTLWRLTQPTNNKSGIARARRKIASARNLYQLARDLKADLYIQRAAGAETGIIASAAHAAGGKFMFMMANDWELDPPWSTGGGISGWLFRRGLRRADLVTCQHEVQIDGVREQFHREAHLLPNIFSFDETNAGSKTGDAILWVGRCVKQKRPERFLELVKSLPARSFMIVAQPTDHERQLFEQIRTEAQRLTNLEWIPGLPADQMQPIYCRAGILVNTSDREGMPNTFLEAANFGLALISFAVDPGKMFERHGAGIIVDGSMERLKNEVERLAKDSAARQSLACDGREWLKSRHDWEHVFPQFCQLIDRVKV